MYRKLAGFIINIVLLGVIINPAIADQKELYAFLRRMAEQKLMRMAKNPIIVNAVEQANKHAEKSPGQIKELDAKWLEAEENDEWVKGFLNNECAEYLKKIQKQETETGEHSLFAEIFVMDKQGCIVGETNLTSDYWQGDEDKFIKSFAQGKGALFMDDPVFDESSGRYIIQISVPVYEASGKNAIGAITFGVDLDVLVERI